MESGNHFVSHAERDKEIPASINIRSAFIVGFEKKVESQRIVGPVAVWFIFTLLAST